MSYSRGTEDHSGDFLGQKDLPVSEEDVRRLRELRRFSPAEVWAFCQAFADAYPQIAQAALTRPTHAGCQAFALPEAATP